MVKTLEEYVDLAQGWDSPENVLTLETYHQLYLLDMTPPYDDYFRDMVSFSIELIWNEDEA